MISSSPYPAVNVLRWGIIGIGDVCQKKSGPAFSKAKNSELVAVCRRTPGKAEEYAKRHGVAKWYTDALDLINDNTVDAVYISTLPDSHLQLALAVAKSGKPCLVEKPLTRTSQEAMILVDAFERDNIPLFVAYYRRSLPRYRLAREWLPRVGKVSAVKCTVLRNKPEEGWRFLRTVAGGGLTVDLGSHCMDIIDWMFGAVKVCRAEAGRRGAAKEGVKDIDVVEDFCDLQFELPLMPNLVKGTARFDFSFDGDCKDEIEIIGDGGTLKFAALGLYGSSPDVEFVPSNGDRGERVEVATPDHVHLNLIQEIVDDVLQGTRHCTSTGRAGLRTAIVIDAALERANAFPRLSSSTFEQE